MPSKPMEQLGALLQILDAMATKIKTARKPQKKNVPAMIRSEFLPAPEHDAAMSMQGANQDAVTNMTLTIRENLSGLSIVLSLVKVELWVMEEEEGIGDGGGGGGVS